MDSSRGVRVAVGCVLACCVAAVTPSYAQDGRRFELGGQLTTLRLSEFETTDVGVGVQAGWRLTPVVAVDGALTWFPGGDDGGFPRIERQQRMLGVVGLRAGVESGRMELFARARPGFLRFAAEDNVPCILIFPPPLSCQVLGGHTSFVTELGGGVRLALDRDRRMFLSFDIGDLLVRYGRQSMRRNDEISDDGFVSHNLVAGVGVGWRF